MRHYLRRCLRDFLVHYPRRLGELVALPWRTAPLRAGYGETPPRVAGRAAEVGVRLAELAGIGLAVQLADALLSGHRYRRPTAAERAFAKALFRAHELDAVRLDQGAHDTAGRLRVAFVLGRVVKSAGPLDPAVLAHELVHVRQFERWGWAYVAKALYAQHRGAGYVYAARWLEGVGVGDLRVTSYCPALNAEQEAARVEDVVRTCLLGQDSRWAYRGGG